MNSSPKVNRATRPGSAAAQVRKILVVEDDDLSQKMMDLILAQRGFEVHKAFNGVAAVEAVKSGEFDLVLMDIQMPVMDGVEACKQIRLWENGKKHNIIIALTAYDIPGQIQECLEAGMDDFISKPFSVQQLLNVLDSILEKKNISSQNVDSLSTASVETQLLDVNSASVDFKNDMNQYKEFLSEFIESLPERLREIRASIDIGDFDLASRKAHNLKGVSASFGAQQLSRAAAQLDECCNRGEMTCGEEAFNLLKTSAEQLVTHSLDLIGR